ncbi:MAG TPA: VOC family protein [Streptosporangiaceae bacterium]|nr:VOC family protein [Streptosporangiaceae bacterium]
MKETEQRGRASGRVAVKRLEQIAIVVNDLAAAMAFFAELGLDLEGEATVEGDTVDRLSGLDGVRSDIAVMRTPDGHGRLELIKYHTPPAHGGDPAAPPNTPGIRHILFSVEGIEEVLDRLRSHGAELVGELVRYENSYRLCYVRGPEGIIVELAEQIR